MHKRTAVVLAAGKGTRMKSRQPKVLHAVAGQPMICHVLDALADCGVAQPVVVVGHGGEAVQQCLGDRARYAWQQEQLGTGHAVMMARPEVSEEVETVMVLCGDTPLLTGATLAALWETHEKTGAMGTVLTAVIGEPKGYGRILRDDAGHVAAIVEEKDADENQKAIREINAGTYCFDRAALFAALDAITPANAQGEYYLTDVLAIFRRQGGRVAAHTLTDEREILGINSRSQLAEAEAVLQDRLRRKWMDAGVTLIDPGSVFFHAQAVIGPDTIIYPQTIIEGETVIGEGCRLGPATRIWGSRIGNNVAIQNSIVLDSQISDDCAVGPFAYLRPGTCLAEEVKVGDFVEIKKSVIGKGSKVPHLSYVGDATVGEGVNIGAGTITCNYDGHNKHTTTIEDGAFIGSNTNLVAPVTVGAQALIGAGSTITKDVPAGALAVERSHMKIKEDFHGRKQKASK
ncbi:bifunctional UDP-N-acetylglucosamine diphosphorylase/glucosamine-1-phosphate N-acetyltransferase GlmU [Heliobacterium gestii]|uniref:Bifunctional protein GlmU n=1 Tax=Heliomicrobium gestii TaxID=2699 RepID=A0A845L7X3_HELGE|nr:bifunctional UDP-N-acetylglucosamine diphosphorylase/glucosamine-1-phosphate N-acetyltransferase GlmU [Heliomicrobium gestii]MBM7866388.1 bifunctional UDP-N-acetylglucosamine pyrophosphorylase/glucosamine-1-phosphate N-acetyltransferase [Heliomicrobium gestii]MZP42827.1 bifunctional UDP-N-acetylglucosamine diphosphorylase/glucosamine-1-phosphate N-acetyltransferase GlmU [Heliomicrobium gestii]